MHAMHVPVLLAKQWMRVSSAMHVMIWSHLSGQSRSRNVDREQMRAGSAGKGARGMGRGVEKEEEVAAKVVRVNLVACALRRRGHGAQREDQRGESFALKVLFPLMPHFQPLGYSPVRCDF